MRTSTTLDSEKLELDAVLASGIFTRAPNLENLLRYVCGKYFEGLADEIKEYNIAVEALGRPPQFDQKRDSIVRVEAHKLRKRLREYYEKEGAGHQIQIEMPPGQYTPRFVPTVKDVIAEAVVPEIIAPVEESRELAVVHDVVEVPARPAPIPPIVPPLPVGVEQTQQTRKVVLLASVLVVVGVIAALTLRTPETVPKVAPPPVPVVLAPEGEEIRILAGVDGGSYVDAFQKTWMPDRYFTGGNVDTAPRTRPFRGTGDQELYKKRREGAFRYDIPLKPGPWELRLHFAEAVFGSENVAGGGEASRVFSVIANGKPLVQELDVLRDVGQGSVDVRVFKDLQAAADGILHLEFQPVSNAPFVNAIELVPGIRGHIRPIRLAARDRAVKDHAGRTWEPDKVGLSGMLIARPEANVVGADPELYRGERYGNLAYSIPVAEGGRYGLNLYFAENWFGKGMPGGGGIGSRIFDIQVNGMAVRRNFDIYKESGGQGRSMVVSLHGVEPNPQGMILINMPPARNYSCINAIEVLDESR